MIYSSRKREILRFAHVQQLVNCIKHPLEGFFYKFTSTRIEFIKFSKNILWKIYYNTNENIWWLGASNSLSTASNILLKPVSAALVLPGLTLPNLVGRYFESFIVNLKRNLEVCMSPIAHQLHQASPWGSWRAVGDVQTSRFLFWTSINYSK